MPFQRQQKWLIPMVSYGKKSRRRTCLTIWDKVKSRGTVTDWFTGREWPVNCMTVISAWWRSNMPFQGRRKWHIPMASYREILSGRLSYYITRWRREVSQFWRSDELETRCGRENSTQRRGPTGLRLSNLGERERHNADGHKSWGQYDAVLFGLQSLSYTTFQIKWEVYFSKRLCRWSLLCRGVYACISIIWVYNKKQLSVSKTAKVLVLISEKHRRLYSVF